MDRFVFAIFFLGSMPSQAVTEWLVKWPQLPVESFCLTESAEPLGVHSLGLGGWTLLRFASDTDRQQFQQNCRAQDWEPNQKLRILSSKPAWQTQANLPVGDDPHFSEQWSWGDVRAPLGLEHPGSIVAVIDTGVDYNHPDLQAALWRNPGETGIDSQGRSKATNGIDDDGNGFVDDVIGWDFVENDNRPFDLGSAVNEGHGTHVSGVIAAGEQNSYGIRGLAPGSRLMVLRFINRDGFGTTAGAVQAIRYALDQGARIINVSWGGDEEAVTSSRALREAFLEAERRGALVVAAAGNSSRDLDENPRRSVPASYALSNMIVVGASGPGGWRATFSNYGRRSVHLTAPGVGVLSTTPGGGVGRMDGTSVAVPHVVSALSLGWARFPELSPLQLREALLSTVIPNSTLALRVSSGGRLDIEAFLNKLSDFSSDPAAQ